MGAPTYSLTERLFRMCVYPFAVAQTSWLESLIYYIARAIFKGTLCPASFDPARAQRSIDLFKRLGAEEHFVTPRDGKARVHMLTLRAQDMEQEITSRGGSWRKVDGMIAIVPPRQISAEWKQFATEVLSKFGWEEKAVHVEGQLTTVIVTCETAENIRDEDCYQKCFLCCHTLFHVFACDRHKSAALLGMKQDICLFDNRGLWQSNGVASEVGHYLDVEAVYDKLNKVNPYRPDQIWIGSYCGAGPVAAHLKAKLHNQGVNFFIEQGFADLKRNFIQPQNWIANWVGMQSIDSLDARDIPQDLPDRPLASQLSIEEIWKKLPFYTGPHGKIVILQTSNDPRLPPSVVQEMTALGQKVNRNVATLLYQSTRKDEDYHADDFYRYRDVMQRFIQCVFSH